MDFGEQVSDLTTPEFKSFYLSCIYKYLQLYLRVKDMRNWFIITTTTITKPSKTITKTGKYQTIKRYERECTIYLHV